MATSVVEADYSGDVVVWLFIFTLVAALGSLLCVLSRHWQRARDARQLHERHLQDQQLSQRQAQQLVLIHQLHQESSLLLSSTLSRSRNRQSATTAEQCESIMSAWCPGRTYKDFISQLDNHGQQSEDLVSGVKGQQDAENINESSSSTHLEGSRGTGGGEPAVIQTIDPQVLGRMMSFKHCSICFEDFQPEESVRCLPCSHFYHKTCIDCWFMRSALCPLCMHDYSEVTSGLNRDNGVGTNTMGLPNLVGASMPIGGGGTMAVIAFLDSPVETSSPV